MTNRYVQHIVDSIVRVFAQVPPPPTFTFTSEHVMPTHALVDVVFSAIDGEFCVLLLYLLVRTHTFFL